MELTTMTSCDALPITTEKRQGRGPRGAPEELWAVGADFEAVLLTQDEDLERILPEWWGLWSRAPAATPFSSPAWLLPWWRTFRPGPLHATALRWRGQLAGLSLAYVEDGAWGRRLLPLGIGVSDYLDVLIDPGVEGVAEALVRETLSHADDWDSWALEELQPGAAGLALPAFGAEPRPQSACPVLALPRLSGWPATSAARRSRRAWNRLERHSGVAIVEGVAGNLHPLLDGLIELHGRRWAENGEAGVLGDAQVRQFHRDAGPRLLDAGLLRLFGLTIGGKLVATYYGFAHRDRAFGYLSGFDPRYRFESPGAALLGHAIRSAIVEGCREFHFLRGQESYKYAWGAVDRWNVVRMIRRAPSPTR